MTYSFKVLKENNYQSNSLSNENIFNNESELKYFQTNKYQAIHVQQTLIKGEIRRHKIKMHRNNSIFQEKGKCYSEIRALSKKRLSCQVILHFEKSRMQTVTTKVTTKRIVKEFLTTKQKRGGGKK